MTEPTTPTYASPLAEARSRIALPSGLVPLNHCSQAPPTMDTLAAAERFLDSWQSRGMDWDTWLGEVEAARSAFARLIGARPQDVAVFSSVSHAAAAVASALDFQERTRIVLTEAEFPTVAHVWSWQERRGARLDWAPVPDEGIDPADVAARLGEDVRLVSISHGHYETGALLPVVELAAAAREVGALTFLDAYQTLGTRRIDVSRAGVDFLACGALKYLMGVAGVAFLYVRPALAERLEPATTGWFGRVEPFAFDAKRLDWAPGARRFDSGTPPLLPSYIARAGIDFLEAVGIEAIQGRVTELAARMMARGENAGLAVLGPRDPALRTANTAFDCCGRPSHEVEARMRDAGFIPSARGRAIRLAPHGYTSNEEVDSAIDALIGILAG